MNTEIRDKNKEFIRKNNSNDNSYKHKLNQNNSISRNQIIDQQRIIQRNPKQLNKENLEIYKNARNNSIGKETKKYEPKKEKFSIKVIASALAVALCATTITIVTKTFKEYEEIIERDTQIVEMIMPKYDGGNIISHSSRRTLDNQGFYYDTLFLANYIIKCEPEYFDLIIFNAYDNMEFNRTENMNELFQNLNFASYNIKETNPELYYKLKDINSFDDYLMKIKCVDENNMPSKEKYKEHGEHLYKFYEESLKTEFGGKTK